MLRWEVDGTCLGLYPISSVGPRSYTTIQLVSIRMAVSRICCEDGTGSGSRRMAGFSFGYSDAEHSVFANRVLII